MITQIVFNQPTSAAFIKGNLGQHVQRLYTYTLDLTYVCVLT